MNFELIVKPFNKKYWIVCEKRHETAVKFILQDKLLRCAASMKRLRDKGEFVLIK